MPFPGATTYPGASLFPGSPRGVFCPPTQDLRFRMEGALFGSEPWGLSVWRVNGVWDEGFTPSAETVAAADRFYGGGRIHPITPAELSDLVAAGYADYITLEG